ncbi:MAG: molecular chaperone TorD family protein [Anaerolineales bacterium]|nr:molecular chaperone TorD family protein [Anaerolineales bacterium]
MMATTLLMATISEQLLARALLYQALAWGLIYPTAERLAGLTEWQDSLATACTALGMSASDVETAVAKLPQSEAARLQMLQVEYTRLFINAVPHVLAPPYASAYNHLGLLLGQPAEAAVQAYRQAGLVFAPEAFDLPDHLAAELEFMFYLSREELAAHKAGDLTCAEELRERRRDFLTHHLLAWLPAWRARVVEADRTGFYATLAQLVETWLRADAAALTSPFVESRRIQP